MYDNSVHATESYKGRLVQNAAVASYVYCFHWKNTISDSPMRYQSMIPSAKSAVDGWRDVRVWTPRVDVVIDNLAREHSCASSYIVGGRQRRGPIVLSNHLLRHGRIRYHQPHDSINGVSIAVGQILLFCLFHTRQALLHQCSSGICWLRNLVGSLFLCFGHLVRDFCLLLPRQRPCECGSAIINREERTLSENRL